MPLRAEYPDYGMPDNRLHGPSETLPTSVAQLASVNGYAAWRLETEVKLAKMEAQRNECRYQVWRLNDAINDLQYLLSNGASGGTAWIRHNDRTKLRHE